jgi:hypothetical protein
MGMPIRALLFALGLGVAASSAVLSTETVAEGKSSHDSPYGYERTWNATLRFVRVDLGMKVVETDHTNGFLLFEYRAGENIHQKPTAGSFELIRTSGDTVHMVVQLAQMPRFHEELLLDKLAQKLHEDYGDVPEPRAPAPPAVDAGPDGNEDNN